MGGGKEGGGKERERDLPSARFTLKCSKEPELDQAEVKSVELNPDFLSGQNKRDPKTCAITYCLPGCKSVQS